MDSKKIKQLVDLATAAQVNAHAPYSGFNVGAAILSKTTHTYSGCNVENVAYPLGQCAEATAIGNMVCNGDKAIAAIVITSPTEDLCFPCGGCRQKIAEFSDESTQVIMTSKDGKMQTLSMAELLPYAFSNNTPTS